MNKLNNTQTETWREFMKSKHYEIVQACMKKHYKVCVNGGVRCGKSTYLVIGVLENLMYNAALYKPMHTHANNALFSAVTHKQIESILIYIARTYLFEVHGIELVKREHYYEFEFASVNGIKKIRIFVASADNVSAYTKIQGFTFRVALLDEAPNFPPNFIAEVEDRLSSFKEDAKLVMSSNPSGDETHPYFKNHIKNADKYITITTEEAGIVPLEKIQMRAQTLSPATFRQRYLAEWVGANDDSAFPNFVIQYHEPVKSYEKYLFIDWGSKDSLALVEISRYEDKHIVTDIFYHSRRETNRQLLSPELVEIVSEMYDNHKMIYVDTAPDLVGQLALKGLPTRGISSKNLNTQYLRVKNLIESGKLYFYRNLDGILEAQIKNAKISKDGKSIAKVNNETAHEEQQIHALDCLTYYANRFFKLGGERD